MCWFIGLLNKGKEHFCLIEVFDMSLTPAANRIHGSADRLNLSSVERRARWFKFKFWKSQKNLISSFPFDKECWSSSSPVGYQNKFPSLLSTSMKTMPLASSTALSTEDGISATASCGASSSHLGGGGGGSATHSSYSLSSLQVRQRLKDCVMKRKMYRKASSFTASGAMLPTQEELTTSFEPTTSCQGASSLLRKTSSEPELLQSYAGWLHPSEEEKEGGKKDKVIPTALHCKSTTQNSFAGKHGSVTGHFNGHSVERAPPSGNNNFLSCEDLTYISDCSQVPSHMEISWSVRQNTSQGAFGSGKDSMFIRQSSLPNNAAAQLFRRSLSTGGGIKLPWRSSNFGAFLESIPAEQEWQQHWFTKRSAIGWWRDHSPGTTLAYHPDMLHHQCVCNSTTQHPENPLRLKAILDHLKSTPLLKCCSLIVCKKANLTDLQLCHGDQHSFLYGSNQLLPTQLCRMSCLGIGIDSETVWNPNYTANAALLAVGGVIEIIQSICKGDCLNGFALVRPPGHNAEMHQAMGYCYFNSIAIGARKAVEEGFLLAQTQQTVKRIAIVDWDIHHGNGTQQIFYSDSTVLYISLHRYDEGAFYPGTGKVEEVGAAGALGYNINIAWASQAVLGDAEYLAAFHSLVLPILMEFQADLVLVSAGFDAAIGTPSALGGYNLSPDLFAWMTWQLAQPSISQGRLALVLEGGYDLSSLSVCVEYCLKALLVQGKCGGGWWQQQHYEDAGGGFCGWIALQNDLQHWMQSYRAQPEMQRRPSRAAVQTMLHVSQCHRHFWKCLEKMDPNTMALSCAERLWRFF